MRRGKKSVDDDEVKRWRASEVKISWMVGVTFDEEAGQPYMPFKEQGAGGLGADHLVGKNGYQYMFNRDPFLGIPLSSCTSTVLQRGRGHGSCIFAYGHFVGLSTFPRLRFQRATMITHSFAFQSLRLLEFVCRRSIPCS